MSKLYSNRLTCSGCVRKFRDTDSLRRHLRRNPEHADREQWVADWVLKPHTVETFRRLPETPDGQSVQVSHDAASNSVRVDGIAVTPIDTAPVADRITGDPQYELRGPYLIVRFQRVFRQTN